MNLASTDTGLFTPISVQNRTLPAPVFTKLALGDKVLWASPSLYYIEIGRKCRKYRRNSIYTRKWSSIQRNWTKM